MRRLLIVADTFAVTDRGVIVAPMPPEHELRGPADVEVELRLPDGTRRTASLSIALEHFYPPPGIRGWTCMFKTLAKSEVPIGTEIWCPDDVFRPRLTIAR